MTAITVISSLSELQGHLSKSPSSKISVRYLLLLVYSSSPSGQVIDFHATWCGPCKMMAPTFEKLSKEYKQAAFYKIDTDAVPEAAQHYNVTAMPTFVFIKGKDEVDRMRGADRGGLESTLRKHAGPPSDAGSAFSGKGQTLGGPAPRELSREASAGWQWLTSRFSTLDGQLQTLIWLAGAYALFLYLSY
ncbi:Thioredoxin domain-containing protein [Mycena kentingensis (nom. inval.)]|nr:Thioredoxin domain-containing protein [Mycena kentingensis (nom. inval.)]